MEDDHTPWHASAVELLHQGLLPQAEKHLRAAPKTLTEHQRAYRDVLLIEVFLGQGKTKEAQALYERLLWTPWVRVRVEMQGKVRRYTEYFLHVWAPRPYDVHTLEPLPAGCTLVGGSVCVQGGDLCVLARSLNVSYDETKKELVHTADRWGRYLNTLFLNRMDSSFRTLDSGTVADRARYPRANDTFLGYEDPRVFVWNGTLWMTATTYQLYNSGKAHTVLCKLQDDSVVSAAALQCPHMNDPQCHWLPWLHKETPHFVYKCNPWTVLRLDDAATGATTVVVEQLMDRWPTDGDVLRPAAGPVPYHSGYLVVLALAEGETRSLYRFVRLSAALIPTHMSSTWVLWEPELETVQGMCVAGEYLYLTCGYHHKELRLTRFSLPLLDHCLSWYVLKTAE